MGTVRRQRSGGKQFNSRMRKKLLVLFMIVLAAFAGLSIRLIWITNENGTKYTRQILSQQQYDSTTLPYRRGDIVDAKGTKLAVSEKVYNLVIDSKVIMSKDAYFEPTMQALADNFDLDMAVVREYVTEHKETSSYYVPKETKKLSYDEISGFLDAQSEDANIKGIWFEEEYERVYPMGTLASDVIGFTGADNTGTYGLEEYYNDVLNGTTGREFGYLTDDSTLERTVKPAVDGYSIHSTIDANIQSIVEKYIMQFNEEHMNEARVGNGAENIGVIIEEVDTGEILAMASFPNYDLNDVRNTDALIGNVLVDESGNKVVPTQYITEEDISDMDETTLYQNLNYLWKNFCIADTYEPGSVAKPFTVAMALETGAITGNEVYVCNGSLHVGDYDIKCHSVDGEVTVQNAIAWSCNVALMKIADSVGASDFAKFQRIFNFGLKTNVDLAGEARTASLVYDETMGDTDLATNSFGQNFNTTMIQVINGFCSLINGGYYYEPHLVNKITNSDGATVENIDPRVLRQTVSQSTSEKIIQYCTACVMPEGGSKRTGKTARPAGYAIGGKTGTAQTWNPVTHKRSTTEYVVSFIGFAPADDPQIAIYCVVDRPNAAAQDDAKFATGIVRNILTEVLPYLNIFMTEELSEDEIRELEERQIAITNQYTQTPEEEDLENETELEGNGEEGQTEEGETASEPAWMSFPIDPDTGYRVDPVTGAQLDPNTGEVVNSMPVMPEDL